MYRYDEFDHKFVAERTAQFRDQAARRLSGEITEVGHDLRRTRRQVVHWLCAIRTPPLRRFNGEMP